MPKSRAAGERSANQIAQGRLLQKARLAAGLEQSEVAEAVGKSVVSISNYENGGFLPRAETLLAMARLYGTTPEQMGLHIVGGKVVQTNVPSTVSESPRSPIADALYDRRLELPVWHPTGPGEWAIPEDAGTATVVVPQSLTQGQPCVALQVGNDDWTLAPTAEPGHFLVVALLEVVPLGRWTLVANGGKCQVRIPARDGALRPVSPTSVQSELDPGSWQRIGVVFGVDKDPVQGRLNVDFEIGGFRSRN